MDEKIEVQRVKWLAPGYRLLLAELRACHISSHPRIFQLVMLDGVRDRQQRDIVLLGFYMRW